MLVRVSIFIIALLAGWGVVAPASMAGVASAALGLTTKYAGWFYLWVVAGAVLFSLFVAFSRYGDLVLGDDDEEPAYSRGAWFSMLFAAGMGIGLVFWGAAEPISHYGSPPPGVTAGTPEAAAAAMRYSFFHWGLHPWAVYCLVALAIGFFQFRRGLPATIGATVSELPRAPAWTGAVVDMLALIATVFGVATSLGFGALQINAGLNAVFGMPIGAPWQVGIVLVTALAFVGSALTGLDRGPQHVAGDEGEGVEVGPPVRACAGRGHLRGAETAGLGRRRPRLAEQGGAQAEDLGALPLRTAHHEDVVGR